MTLLRFITAGSVDDGKSTLIGRLLYDSQNVLEDQLAAVGRASKRKAAEGLDLSLLTDGLRAEREQGITIDVAYRYFATERRKFILADTPGHDEYTRNMATAASTADAAILLVDARHGLRHQSHRHARIAALLGIRHLVVAVNKMDLVGYDERVFRDIEAKFLQFATTLPRKPDLRFIPISAFAGDNVVTKSAHMPWYDGAPLLELLESAELASHEHHSFYFPIQTVLGEGYAGQIAGGAIEAGDEVVLLPSGERTRVQRIATYDGDLAHAAAPLSVTLVLENDPGLSRGDAIVAPSELPSVTRHVRATMIWFDEKPLDAKAVYLLKHTTRTVKARVLTNERVGMNDITSVDILTTEPLIVKPYVQNRAAGSFILIDPVTNATAAACLCLSTSHSPPPG